MRLIILIFFALFFSGCSQGTFSSRVTVANSSGQLVDEVSLKVAKKLKAEMNLVPAGFGSQMRDQIKMIALSFFYYGPVDIEKARELLLAATNDLISAVNDDVRIRPHLNNYPFGPKNVEIRIFLYNTDGTNPPVKELSVITLTRGILRYKVDDPKNPLFTTVLEESYSEAEEKQRNSIGIK